MSAGAYCGKEARCRSDNNTMKRERLARRGARLYSVQFPLCHLYRPQARFRKSPETRLVLCRLLNSARFTAAFRRPRRINWHAVAIRAQLRGLCRLPLLAVSNQIDVHQVVHPTDDCAWPQRPD